MWRNNTLNQAWLLTRRARRLPPIVPQDTLALVRWAALAPLLLVALLFPVLGWAGIPSWAFILVYAALTLLAEVLNLSRWAWFHSRSNVVRLNLLLTGALYALGQDDDGPLYALFVLAIVTAAATLAPAELLVYGALVTLFDAGAELSLRGAFPANEILERIATRTLVLGFIVIGTVGFVRRLDLEQAAVRQARDEAERTAELERVRGNVIAAVTHDLQTPLTALRAGLGLLETSAQERLLQDEAQLLVNARRNVDRLGLQINDFLSLNQLEAEMFQLNAAPFDLRTVVAGVVAVAHPLVRQKGQELQVDVDEPLDVLGDPRRLEQAVLNLAVNAHRHTPRGTTITLRGRAAGERVELQVSDTGPGIPEAARAHIFERFFRADETASGSGLGLTIAKAVIERHGGSLSVASEPGRGAVFTVVLPRYDPTRKEMPCP